MTELFSNGFEEGNFNAWSGTSGAPTVQDAIKHHGTYAEQASNAGSGATDYAYKTVSGYSECGFRC